MDANVAGGGSREIRVGDFTIHRIVEDQGAFTPARDFLPGLTEDVLAEHRPWLRETGALDADDRLILCFQAYLVRTPTHTILVDTCVGNEKERARPSWHMKSDGRFLEGLAAAGVAPEQIDVVMCTHLHVDHVGWNTQLRDGRWVPTFPNARYLFSRREFDHWTAEHAKAPLPHFADSVLPVVEAGRAEFVTSDHGVGDHVRLLPTPGHTPDHFAVRLGRGRDDAVITGDLLHSPIQARYPELSMRADTDQAQSAATRRSFLDRYCDTPTLCCTMHFPSRRSGRSNAGPTVSGATRQDSDLRARSP